MLYIHNVGFYSILCNMNQFCILGYLKQRQYSLLLIRWASSVMGGAYMLTHNTTTYMC